MFDEPEVNAKNNFFMRSSNVVGPVISNVISVIGPSLGIKPNIENKIEN